MKERDEVNPITSKSVPGKAKKAAKKVNKDSGESDEGDEV